jgi:hypothetical protein
MLFILPIWGGKPKRSVGAQFQALLSSKPPEHLDTADAKSGSREQRNREWR